MLRVMVAAELIFMAQNKLQFIYKHLPFEKNVITSKSCGKMSTAKPFYFNGSWRLLQILK